ncbi:hypothetical protein ACWDTI_13270 [Gordonia sp. NPDC003424]
MITRLRSAITPLTAVIGALVVLLAGFLIWNGHGKVIEQQQGKADTTTRCVAVLRDDVRTTFEMKGGNSVADSEKLADEAQFTGIRTRNATLTDEQRRAIRDAGHSIESIDRAYRITGSISIPGFARSGPTYGPNNTFTCETAVFTDNEVMVLEHTIN